MIDAAADRNSTDAARLGGTRLAVWAIVAVVGIDLIFFSGASNFLASPQARILNQLLFVGAGAALAIAAWRGAVDVSSPLILRGLAWIAATVAATVLSQRPATSLEALTLLLLAAPAYLAVRAVLWTGWLRPRVDRLLVAATLVFVVAYLGQVLLQWVDWWSVAGPSVPPLRPGDVGLTIGTVNAIALHLELLVPVAAWLAWRELGRAWLGALIAGLGLVALVITGSRGAWIGAVAAGLIAAGIAWAQAGRPLPAVRGRGIGRVLAVVLAVLVLLAALAILGLALLPRLMAGDAGRGELWSAAWAMFTGQPVTGTGPGTFPLLRPDSPISEANLAVLTTSHNSVLQVLVDVGVLGLAAGAWIVVAVARLATRMIRLGGPASAHGSVPGSAELALVVTASLVAMLVHSVVDTQFHVPAVVLLVFLLVARLDPPVVGVPARPTASRLLVGSALIAVGVVLLIPVDAAMVRAQLGNNALDRGDALAALEDFRWAAGLHELPPYRLGEGVAASRLGDTEAAAAAFSRAESLHGLTFVAANRATVTTGPDRDAVLTGIEAAGPYDVTAWANAAVLRYPDDPDLATADLAGAMTGAPTLIFSERPPDLFDDATWREAQVRAVDAIGTTDPATAAALAILAGIDGRAARYRPLVVDAPSAEALDLLSESVQGGTVDLDRAHALLRESPASQGLQNLIWLLGFQTKSQSLIDDVRRLSVPQFFGLPMPPMELVVDGKSNADYSLRLPRYPMASDFRNGPKRPYAAGMVTIEPVYRPK